MRSVRLGRLASLAASVGLAVAVAACGAQTVTKKDVIARGNQICETAASSVRAVAPPSGQSASDLARYYKEVTPIVETEIHQLGTVPRPSQDRALLDQFRAAITRSAGEYRALVAATRSGDRAAFESASAALRANPAAILAARYGITECGGPLGTAA